MSGLIWRLFRLWTLLVVVMLVAISLGGLWTLQWRGCFMSNQGQVRVWTGQRNRYQQLAEQARSNGDIDGAAKWDKLAVYADQWRRVFEHRVSGGGPGREPPIPKDPLWPPVSKQPH